ncbi:hypothetical protein Mapa_000927 [Marchantia paleacea]|nr:hypothetical protein Mapa_000927 [Marchantia paleacea]
MKFLIMIANLSVTASRIGCSSLEERIADRSFSRFFSINCLPMRTCVVVYNSPPLLGD